MSRPSQWAAGLTGGVVASSSLFASMSALWAALPAEVRGFVGALIAGFVAELATVGRAWLRARASRALGVRVPDDQASPGETPAAEPATVDQAPAPSPAAAEEHAEGGDRVS